MLFVVIFAVGPILLWAQLCIAVMDVSWWSSVAQLSTSLSGQTARPTCDRLNGLSPGQAKICNVFEDHMPAVGVGAKNAIQECQYRFKAHRWNCSTPYNSGIVGPIHKLGTREAAFTYAILSAGVMHEVGRRCRQGLLNTCGCADEPKERGDGSGGEKYAWGGCGDNVEYGYKFSKDFIDVREKERDPKRDNDQGRSLMNRRNNEAGRRLLKKNMVKTCKCHGVSGACNLQTCWMQLPKMANISKLLMKKYDNALRVQISSRGNLQLVASDQIGRKRRNRAIPTDLVYLDDSPDYCIQNRAMGTIGTEGRICVRGSDGPEGCDSLCCGRGYNTYTITKTEKCNCKFEWCCKVVCQMCTNTTQVDICK